MAGMFPSMVADPSDRNRRYSGPVGDQWPAPLRAGYWCFLLAAVLMLVASFLMLRAGTPAELDHDVALSFRRNMRIVAVGNIILALCLTACAAFFERGSKRARRLATLFIFLTVFLNFAGFFVGVAGWVVFAIVVLLAVGAFLIFRPSANAFVDERSGDVWRNVR